MKCRIIVLLLNFVLLINCLYGEKIKFSFGTITAVGELYGRVTTGVNFNWFFYKKFVLPLELSVGITYQEKKDISKIKLIMFPMTVGYVKKFELLDRHYIFLKTSFGGILEVVGGITPAMFNYDPVFTLSFGTGLKSNKFILRPELSYIYIFQKYIRTAKYDGNFLCFNIGLFY
ncbi:MAG: hypothetical protein NZ839_03755 [Endomicrobia bacterium]|nr:hypothetical protein [Endomicrobiia bacterium]